MGVFPVSNYYPPQYPYSPYYSPNAALYQQQLQQIAQPQQQMPSTQRQNSLTIRTAANMDEVRATPVDFGTVNVFVNLGADEMYLSRINSQGMKDIFTYKLMVDAPEAAVPQAPAVDLTGVNAKLDEILQRMVTSDEPDHAGNAGNARRPKPPAVPAGANAEQP